MTELLTVEVAVPRKRHESLATPRAARQSRPRISVSNRTQARLECWDECGDSVEIAAISSAPGTTRTCDLLLRRQDYTVSRAREASVICLTVNIICYELQPPADDDRVKRVTSISICFQVFRSQIGHRYLSAPFAPRLLPACMINWL
jgi:hypothetical protein